MIGREIPLDWLTASTAGSPATLRAAVDELAAIGVLFRRARTAAETYAFKHALVRDVAYEAIRRPVRRDLHLLVARVLREAVRERGAGQARVGRAPLGARG
ncbi:MAG: hypothetical protein IPK07_13230 [Deltaproteobacteria bacterium]|nr:hypothetical protein [Deltaproteobacteria bacterium]